MTLQHFERARGWSPFLQMYSCLCGIYSLQSRKRDYMHTCVAGTACVAEFETPFLLPSLSPSLAPASSPPWLIMHEVRPCGGGA